MCNYPDFDPEQYNKVDDVALFNNNAVNSTYEPGSIFKPITMAAAIDAGKVTPFSTYVDKGVERVAGFDIKNSDEKAHGVQTMTGVLELSLNTGTIFAVRQIGSVTFSQYVKNFGFGRESGVDLSPEASGDIKSLDNKGEIFMDTASFGQGITVTPLQMVVAYAALANNGQILQPYVVDKIVYPNGTEKKTESRVIANAVSATTAKHLGSMLVSVVENGHSKGAKIAGYLLGGKTGTAQVASGGGYGADTIHSFLGFAPLENPQFVMLVKMDNVQKGRFAESSALPTFTKIAKFFLNYYTIPTTVKK
jgi:cell division protein FtsI/penicillin-binding protein 2